MSANTFKTPKSHGAKKALEAVKKFRNQQPSNTLVKIISEYNLPTKTEVDRSKKPSLAAKDMEI